MKQHTKALKILSFKNIIVFELSFFGIWPEWNTCNACLLLFNCYPHSFMVTKVSLENTCLDSWLIQICIYVINCSSVVSGKGWYNLCCLYPYDTIICLYKLLFTQAVRPEFKFRLRFFFPRSVTNRRLVSKAHASAVHTYMELTEVVVVKS